MAARIDDVTEQLRAAMLETGSSPAAVTAQLTQIAASEGDPGLAFRLAVRYERGLGVDVDPTQASALLRSAAEGGHPAAQVRLAKAHLEGGLPGCAQDPAEAKRWYETAREHHHPAAVFALHTMHLNGVGTPKDPEAADALLQEAAGLGHPESMFKVGMSLGRSEEEEARGNRWLQKAADAGHTEAKYRLGLVYEHGAGVPIDLARTAALTLEAAEEGHAEACLDYGEMLLKGRGVEAAPGEAVGWFQRVAEGGCPKAYPVLAKHLFHGIHCDKDEGKARQYQQQAERAGLQVDSVLPAPMGQQQHQHQHQLQQGAADAAAAAESVAPMLNLPPIGTHPLLDLTQLQCGLCLHGGFCTNPDHLGVGGVRLRQRDDGQLTKVPHVVSVTVDGGITELVTRFAEGMDVSNDERPPLGDHVVCITPIATPRGMASPFCVLSFLDLANVLEDPYDLQLPNYLHTVGVNGTACPFTVAIAFVQAILEAKEEEEREFGGEGGGRWRASIHPPIVEPGETAVSGTIEIWAVR